MWISPPDPLLATTNLCGHILGRESYFERILTIDLSLAFVISVFGSRRGSTSSIMLKMTAHSIAAPRAME